MPAPFHMGSKTLWLPIPNGIGRAFTDRARNRFDIACASHLQVSAPRARQFSREAANKQSKAKAAIWPLLDDMNPYLLSLWPIFEAFNLHYVSCKL